MYLKLLSLHNVIRWVVLIFGLTAAYRSFMGLSAQKEWAALDRRWGLAFSISLDIQCLLGLFLYFFLSPITRNALSNGALALQNTNTWFYVLIHSLYMISAIVFAHLGKVLSPRANTSLVKHQRAATFFTLATLCILLGIPWTRPLLPGY